AAIAVASYIIFCWGRWEELQLEGPFMGLVVLLSLLMVSTVSYQTLPKLAFDSGRSVLNLVAWIAAVIAVVVDPKLMAFPMVLLYVFSGIVTWVVLIGRQEDEVAVPLEE
ncbi:uncharacterized protein METZ01_LOCUS320887, partial [marine metagenome]